MVRVLGAFDARLRRVFHAYGVFAFRQRHLLCLGSLLFTALASTGWLFFTQQFREEVEELFTPSDGHHYYARRVMTDHWPMDEENFYPNKFFDYNSWYTLIFWRPDRGNILETDTLKRLLCFNQFLSKNNTVQASNGRSLSYSPDLCMKFEGGCPGNEYLSMMHEYIRHRQNISSFREVVTGRGAFTDTVKNFRKDYLCWQLGKVGQLTYPTARMGGQPFFLALGVANASMAYFDNDTESNPCHHELGPYVSNASHVRLSYHTRYQQPDYRRYGRTWGRQLEQLLEEHDGPLYQPFLQTCGDDFFEVINAIVFDANSSREALAHTYSTLPKDIIIGGSVLAVFALLCSMMTRRDHRWHSVGIDWYRSKPLVALTGLVVVLMAGVASIGLLLWLGLPVNHLLLTVPSLVLGVGVDDMFILLAAWHRTEHRLSTEGRLAVTLEEAGVSITVTTVTDVLAFSVTCITPIPALRMFGVVMAVSLLTCYVFQMTWVVPALAYSGQLEQDGTLLGYQILNRKGDKPSDTEYSRTTIPSEFFGRVYAPLLLNPLSRCVVFVVYLVYLAVSIYGMTQLDRDADIKFITAEEGPMYGYLHEMQQTFYQQGYVTAVIVSNAPNLALPEHRDRVRQLVDEMESTEYSLARSQNDTTMFWLNEFESQWLAHPKVQPMWPDIDGNTRRFYLEVADWFRVVPGKNWWAMDLVFDDYVDAVHKRRLPGFDVPDVFGEFDRIWMQAQTRFLLTDQSEPEDMWSAVLVTVCDDMYMINETDTISTEELREFCQQAVRNRRFDGRLGLLRDESMSDVRAQWLQHWKAIRLLDFHIITAFRFEVALVNWTYMTDWRRSLEQMTAIEQHYPAYNVTSYNFEQYMAAMASEMLPSLLQNLAICIPLVLLVCLLLIPSYISAVVIALSIVSIDIGMFGLMALWDVALGPTVLVTVIMSIGFAVDFSAHMSYSYVTHDGSPEEKCRHALQAVGWPIVQGAMSTILGMSHVSQAEANVTLSFFKVTFLVVLLGMIHGILFLPAAMVTVLPWLDCDNSKGKVHHTTSNGTAANGLANGTANGKATVGHVDNNLITHITLDD